MKQIIKDLIEFRDARGWTKYHSAENLAYALACEAGELLQLFQWGKEPPHERIREEVADIAIYCCYLAVAGGWEEDLNWCGWGSISPETGSVNIFIDAAHAMSANCEETDKAVMDIWLQCRMIAAGGEYNHLREWIAEKIIKNTAKYPCGIDHEKANGWTTEI